MFTFDGMGACARCYFSNFQDLLVCVAAAAVDCAPLLRVSRVKNWFGTSREILMQSMQRVRVTSRALACAGLLFLTGAAHAQWAAEDLSSNGGTDRSAAFGGA